MIRSATNIAAAAACGTLLALAVPWTGAGAQEADSAPPGPRLVVRPAFYFSNTDGDARGGTRPPYTIAMADSVLVVNWTGQAEYDAERFALLADVAWSTTKNVAMLEPSGRPAEYDFRLLTADGVIGYQPGTRDNRAQMLIFVGARYYRTEVRLTDSASAAAVGTYTEDWLAPVLGSRGRIRMASRMEGWVRFDVSARIAPKDLSAFTWLLHLGMDWWIVGPVGVTVQYRYMQIDTGRTGSRPLAYDGPSQGWVTGLSFRF
jgi:hypothetical protein